MSRSAALTRCLAAVRRSLRALDRALGDFATAIRDYQPTQSAPSATAGRRRPKLSAAGRAALKLQGRYMGHMRQLKPAQKTLVRAVKEKSGTKAAIKKAQELAGKRKAA